jgi:hypothetical protein
MSLLWRKRFKVMDGDTLVGSFHLMMRNAATGLARLCGLCPCETGWNISMLCPCTECGNYDASGLGEDARFPETFPTGGGAHPKADQRMWDGQTPRRLIRAITILDGLWPPKSNGGADPQDPSVHGIAGQYISAVRYYLTSAADFAADVTADLILDGEIIKTLGPFAIGANEEYGWIGRTEMYDAPDSGAGQYESDAWLIDSAMLDEGDHRMDLRITYDGGASRLVRTVRTPIRIHLDEGPNLRDVVIVPAGLDHDCRYPTADIGIVMARLEKLKGPFRTKADAELVYSTWQTMIEANAKKCRCQPSGCGFKIIGYQFAQFAPGIGWRLEGFGGIGDPVTNTGCDSAYVTYSFTTGSSVFLRKTDADGTVSIAPPSGVLAPCERIQAYSLEEPDCDPEDFGSDPTYGLSGDHGYVSPPVDDCPFCEDPDDPEAPEYCIYSNAEWDAIPNNSDELDALLGGEP